MRSVGLTELPYTSQSVLANASEDEELESRKDSGSTGATGEDEHEGSDAMRMLIERRSKNR